MSHLNNTHSLNKGMAMTFNYRFISEPTFHYVSVVVC